MIHLKLKAVFHVVLYIMSLDHSFPRQEAETPFI